MTYLAILVALQAAWAWAYRGGSDGFGLPDLPVMNRFVDMLLTPLFVCGSLALVADATLYEYAALGLGGLLMLGAQADGWGRQMDLGDNDKPDNETGYRLRDLFFKSKSSFGRDLTGLFMRMAQFIPSAVAMWFFDPLAAIIPGFLAFGTPLVWVFEHFALKRFGSRFVPWNPTQPVAWAEWIIGAINAILTILVVMVIS